MKLYCEVNEVCMNSHHSNEEYGSWEEHYEFSIDTVSSKKSEYSEEFDLNVSKGERVFSLSVIYSTGDSFGYATGRGEIVWLFSKKEYAEVAMMQYKGQQDKKSVNLDLEMSDSTFEKVKFSNVGWGYFENLEDVKIKEHVVK